MARRLQCRRRGGFAKIERPATVIDRRESIPGTGLPSAALGSILLASVALFVMWNGLLWRAPREASHVGRFVVVPLSAALLVVLRRLSWARLVTTTGTVWALKLLITAVLYQALARGTATHLVAAPPPPSALFAGAARGADRRLAPAVEAGR